MFRHSLTVIYILLVPIVLMADQLLGEKSAMLQIAVIIFIVLAITIVIRERLEYYRHQYDITTLKEDFAKVIKLLGDDRNFTVGETLEFTRALTMMKTHFEDIREDKIADEVIELRQFIGVHPGAYIDRERLGKVRLMVFILQDRFLQKVL